MASPLYAASTPTPLLQRAVTWWLAQAQHALPPTIFFFVGFNLILWTKRLHELASPPAASSAHA